MAGCLRGLTGADTSSRTDDSFKDVSQQGSKKIVPGKHDERRSAI
jgi:hypothetical protein